MDSIYLQGSEQVQSAGRDIAGAMTTFSQQVGYLSEALERHYQRMDELVTRLEVLAEKEGESR